MYQFDNLQHNQENDTLEAYLEGESVPRTDIPADPKTVASLVALLESWLQQTTTNYNSGAQMINFTQEDLNQLFRPAVEEYKMQVLEVLNQAHAAGAHHIDIEVRGAGDSGCCEGIYFSNKDYKELKLDINVDIVKEWSWDLAYSTCPGFEINDGGGMNINISISDDDSVEVIVYMYTLETTTERFYRSDHNA